MADLSELQAAGATKVVGSNTSGVETNAAKVSSNQDLGTSDILDSGGVDAIVALTTTPVQLKVGASALANRKYMVIEALSTNVVWGFSNTTQSFDIFKSQLIMIPVGPNTQVWAKMSTGTGNIAVGEVA